LLDWRTIDNVAPKAKSAHVIVVGNEKGGSGKSTLAMHVIVALLKAGRRVASIDTDGRQLSLTRYLENRARWSRKHALALELPAHFSVRPGDGETVSEIERQEHAAFRSIISRLGEAFDFVVIDTPGSDSYRMRLSHAIANTLITPVNDSFIDLDVLGRIDPERLTVIGASHYAELVRSGRRERHLGSHGETDWVVVRNRLSTLSSRNRARVTAGLDELAALLEFRVANGVSERVIFRELFPVGLTALDRLDRATLGVRPTASHLAARREMAELLAFLRLPAADAPAHEAARPPPLAIGA